MRVALVTGGAQGIGCAAAVALARAGYGVAIADLDSDGAADVARAITRSGGAAIGVGADVSREEDWPAILGAVAQLGRLEALVSNAGIFPRIAFADCSVANFDRVFAVNLKAAFIGASLCLPLMRERGGAMVFMTSGSGLMRSVHNPMQRGFSLYGASKAALDRWALGIAQELAPVGLAVNVLGPGAPVLTRGFEKLGLGAEAPSQTITPERVAEAIVHLAGARPPETGARYVATEFGESWGRTSARTASHSASKA